MLREDDMRGRRKVRKVLSEEPKEWNFKKEDIVLYKEF